MGLQWVHGRITVVMFVPYVNDVAERMASMGPRSDNRGYAERQTAGPSGIRSLQWVHGRITVVMKAKSVPSSAYRQLQWVHGRITVVMTVEFTEILEGWECFNGSTVG